MPYVIEFYRDDEKIGEYIWPDNLKSAKEHIVEFLPVHGASHGAVLDAETRRLLFSHPEPTDDA